MATKKISELVAINEAASNDLLVIVDVSEGTTNKITKGDLLIGAGHSIEMSLNPATYTLTLTLKNEAGTELSTESIDLPNENAITGITYSNGILTLTKQSGGTSTVDISGLISGLQSEITNNNKLSSDLVDDTNKTNKFTNETEKATWNGKYNKPSGGIPKTDLSSDVQTSLEKADTALQAHQDISGKEDKSNKVTELSDSSTDAQYPSAKAVYNELAELKQENEDLKNNQLPWTPTKATSIDLQDSADMKTKRFDLIGRTTQESTTGKQLFDVNAIENTNIVIENDGKTLKMPISTSAVGYTPTNKKLSELCPEIQVNDIVYLYFERNLGTSYNNFIYLSGYGQIWNNGTSKTIIQQMLDSEVILYGNRYDEGETGQCILTNFRMTKIENAQWEKYTGGEPAPNPSYPFPIKNTGDNGSVNEKIVNANMWDEQWEVGGINNDNGQNNNANTVIRSKNYIPINPNTQIYTKNGTDYAWFYAYDKDKNFLGYAFGTSSSVANEIKTTIANCYYLRFQCRSQYGTTYNNDICINVSDASINGTYIAHEEQNISIPLSQGQKLMQGDYPDDDEKVHHKRKQFTLDGSQLMSKFIYNSNLSTTNYSCFLYNDNEIKQATNDTEVFVLADKLKGTPSNQRTSDMANCWINHLSAGQLGMHVPNTITNTTELKTWLTESPITFEVPLAEETTEDFTEEQKTAWEQIKKARTYKPVTHIFSEDETPANIDMTYYRDLETVINNITTRVETIESEV